MKPKKMNKKGQVWISSLLSGIKGIFTGLADGIKSVIDIIPKPVKIVLFLLILLLLGNFINLAIRYFGIQCNTGNTPMKITNVVKNQGLIGATPDYDNINLYGAEIGEAGYTSAFKSATKCTTQVTDAILTNGSSTYIQLHGTYWFYDANECQPCPDDKEYGLFQGDGEGTALGLKISDSVCYGNVFRTNLSWFKQTFLCGEGFMDSYLCRVPEHYYFDYTQNLYLCLDDTCQNVTIGDRWNALLEEAGAKPLYPNDINTSESNNIKRAVGITCNELKPRLTVFTIDIFDYTFWILGLIIAFLLWVAINLKRL